MKVLFLIFAGLVIGGILGLGIATKQSGPFVVAAWLSIIAVPTLVVLLLFPSRHTDDDIDDSTET